ncbi:TPA: cell division protein FtsA [bacterium]|nr:cell division protein FtsA [bacterium]
MSTIVGLDIGTTKVCVCIGNLTKNGEIEIVGEGTKPCLGLARGMVSNIQTTVSAIEDAMKQARYMSGEKIESVIVGISGGTIKGVTKHGLISIKKEREISKFDINRVIEIAKAGDIPSGREIIYTLSQSFNVDDHDGIENPVGMTGHRLEADVYIITSATTAIQNLTKCIEKAGYRVIGKPVASLLAASLAVLYDDEMRLGVCLIDVGGGTTDMGIFLDGTLHHLYSIPIGGTNVTSDISKIIRTSIDEAEKLKKERGCCLSSLVLSDEEISFSSLGEISETVPRHALSEIIQSRMEEIFSLLNNELERFKPRINAGCVLIGGGSMINGAVELAKEMLGMSCRIGVPKGIAGLTDAVNTPIYATPAGLVVWGVKHYGKKASAREAMGWFSKIKEYFT